MSNAGRYKAYFRNPRNPAQKWWIVYVDVDGIIAENDGEASAIVMTEKAFNDLRPFTREKLIKVPIAN